MTEPTYLPSLTEILSYIGDAKILGVSGYSGSGKTTLAGLISARLGGAAVSIDEFATPRVLERSSDFDGLDRGRLIRQVLEPFRRGESVITYDSCDSWDDWTTVPVTLPLGEVVVVDGAGIFHPDLLPYFDHTIWLDVNLETALQRCLDREAALGRDESEFLRTVWAPNEEAFDRQYRPRELADALVVPG